MSKPKNRYKIKAKVWLYPGMAHSTSSGQAHSTGSGQAGAWHFVTIPKKQSANIKKVFGLLKRGWGSLPVVVTIGKTSWKTSIFPDSKTGTYLLPLKSEVRQKEKISRGDTIGFLIEIMV